MWFPLKGIPCSCVTLTVITTKHHPFHVFIFPFAKLLISDAFVSPSTVLVLPSATVGKHLQHKKLFKSKKTGRGLKECIIAKCTLQSPQGQPVPNSDCTLSNRCTKHSKSPVKSLAGKSHWSRVWKRHSGWRKEVLQTPPTGFPEGKPQYVQVLA